MLTLATARTQLWNYASTIDIQSATDAEKQQVTDKINQVVERFLAKGKWKNTMRRATFTVYDQQITLPRSIETVLGVDPIDSACCNAPMSIYSQWYRFSKNGPGNNTCCMFRNLNDLGNGFVTFRPLPTSGQIKIVTTTTENEDQFFYVRGYASNQKVYTSSGSARIEGEAISIPTANGGDSTSVTTFDSGSSLYLFNKPSTYGVINVYLVNGSDETLIASLEPSETTPNYHRFEVPAASTENTDQVLALCKLAYVEAVVDIDPIIYSVGAIKLGLQALAYEDNLDRTSAREAWGEAELLLDSEKQEFEGDSEIFPIQMACYGAGGIPNIL